MTKTIRTTCTMDCPDSCALDVIVTEGKITRIQAAPAERSAHPNTQGFICDKVGRFDRRVYHDTRILYPQRRVGPKGEARFERISWDEAISTIAERFRAIIARWGAEAILPYHYDGSNGLLLSPHIDHLFDEGYVTFSSSQELVIVPEVRDKLLDAWGIDAGVRVGEFTKEQTAYLDYHRANVFKHSLLE